MSLASGLYLGVPGFVLSHCAIFEFVGILDMSCICDCQGLCCYFVMVVVLSIYLTYLVFQMNLQCVVRAPFSIVCVVANLRNV